MNALDFKKNPKSRAHLIFVHNQGAKKKQDSRETERTNNKMIAADKCEILISNVDREARIDRGEKGKPLPAGQGWVEK